MCELQSRKTMWIVSAISFLFLFLQDLSTVYAQPSSDDSSSTRSAITRKRISRFPPDVRNFFPRKNIIAGETLEFTGRNLRKNDFVAKLNLRQPVVLPVVSGSKNKIVVRVPKNAVTRGSALVVRYKGGGSKTLDSKYRVLARPRITGFKVRRGPYIGVASSIEITLSNFSGLENAEVNLRSKNCWTLGLRGPKMPGRNRAAKIIFPITFQPGGDVSKLPGKTLTERLMALSGRKCFLELSFRRPSVTMRTGKAVKMPRVAVNTISKTWNLKNFTTPSGKKLRVRTKGTTLPTDCGPMSVGTAGTFNVGVVNQHGDISFQLRNGVTNLSCEFVTTPRLQVRPGWLITEVDWHIKKDQHCYPSSFHTEQSPGSWGAPPNPIKERKFLNRVKVRAQCVVDSKNRTRNNHLFRATLRKVVIIGPRGQSWKMAFR